MACKGVSEKRRKTLWPTGEDRTWSIQQFVSKTFNGTFASLEKHWVCPSEASRDRQSIPSRHGRSAVCQLVSDPDFEGPEGRIAHLGIMTEDLEAALEEVYKWNVTQMPQGRHWVALPDGLSIELMQATGDSVAEALAVDPRA